MIYIKDKKLNNPPIKQVIVGMLFENIFKSFDKIVPFYENSDLKNIFPKKEITQTIAIQMNNAPQLTQDVSDVLKLSNDNLEELYIESNRLLYIDRHEYINYNAFIDKFFEILNCFFVSFVKEFKIKELGLRYINFFNISQEKLGKTFYICPGINLSKKTNESDFYALMRNHLLVSNIISTENPNMSAVIKNVFNPINSAGMLDVLFDIDTNLRKEYTLNSTEDLKLELSKLKEFKNQIFFSNFKNAYEEFK